MPKLPIRAIRSVQKDVRTDPNYREVQFLTRMTGQLNLSADCVHSFLGVTSSYLNIYY